jgi:nitroreductase
MSLHEMTNLLSVISIIYRRKKMDAVTDAIRKRRSVRSYESRHVPKDIINAIIEAGNEAPSAMNSQPWRFVVVEDKKIREKLLGAAMPNAKKILEPLKDADPERYQKIKKRYGELEDPLYFSAPALAAYSLGLRSCWVGFGAMVTDDTEVRKLLQLWDDEKIFGPILLGYARGYPERPPKREPQVKWL